MLWSTFSSKCMLLLVILFAAGGHATGGKAGRFYKYQHMAKEQEGHIAEKEAMEHIGYSSRDLQAMIHNPIRATQLSNSPGGLVLERIQNGGWVEHLGILGEFFQAKELDEIFEEPQAVSAILEHVEIFQAVKGIPEIAAKGAELTAEDGAHALKILRAWSAKSIRTLSKLADDPSKHLAENLQKFADTDNEELRQLFEQAGTGNKTAGLQAQQIISDDQFDGLFDTGALGFNGEEAPANKQLRERAFANPLLASFLGDIPEAMGFVASPTTIEEQAQKLLGVDEL